MYLDLFLHWRNVIEVLFFSTICYAISCWLRADQRANLLGYWYSYLFILFCAYMLQLTSISYFLLLFAPVIIMIFMFAHDHTLQRNLITYKNNIPNTITHNDWLDHLMRICLTATNENKIITCVIEHNDQLAPFISCAFPIDAPLNEQLLCTLIKSSAYNQNQLIWITNTGMLKGINSTWHKKQSDQKIKTGAHLSWEHDAIRYSTKTDTLIMHTHPNQLHFTLIVHGELHEQLNAHHVYAMIKKHTGYQSAPYQKEHQYDTHTQKTIDPQRTS